MSEYFQPLGGNAMPRCGGIATMMRLPHVATAEGLDACFVGVPFDLGTSNRTGARFGPRQIRNESVLLRPYNMATRAAPFDSLQVADIGDVAINPYNLHDSIARIETAYDDILKHGAKPITMGAITPLRCRSYARSIAFTAKWGSFTWTRMPTSTTR